MEQDDGIPGAGDALAILLPLLIVLSTLLFLLLLFLVCVLVLRRRRGIALSDNDGPIDLSREEYIGTRDGAFDVVETRWLESVSEQERSAYQRSQTWQIQYPPNSLPTDITLSQFLSIQEKGVSAWSFEPDYESATNLLVHARTELTFLPDPSSSSSVQSNLPLPKLNEVYYWEVKMFDLPPTTNVSIGLATKPYPSFRLPGLNRHSVAYHSNGEKSYNYPFTVASYGPPLKEGDVLGIGYRPRSGTVFFTRNGRKMEEAFCGLTRFNLFPTVGADGPCSVHVNLGQAGFVHIEANVKKWGLAPSVGTLAPPPAYGSERGSILLEAGTGISQPASGRAPGSRGILPPINPSARARATPSASASATPPRRTSRPSRRSKPPGPLSSTVPITSSPLRGAPASPSRQGDQAPADSPQDIAVASNSEPRYISPTDAPYHSSSSRGLPPPSPSEEPISGRSTPRSQRSSRSASPADLNESDSERQPLVTVSNEVGEIVPDSPDLEDPGSPSQLPNPPTPHVSDIHLQTLNFKPHSRHTSIESVGPPVASPSRSRRSHNRSQSASAHTSHPTDYPRRSSRAHRYRQAGAHHQLSPTDSEPPAYSPLDSYVYPNGVAIDLPAEIIAAALDGPTPAQRAASALGVTGTHSSATDAQRAAARAAFETSPRGR